MTQKLDPTKLADWQIAEAAEETMLPVGQLADILGLKADELIPWGRQLAKIDQKKVLARVAGAKQGKYIDVTAITPTPLGEGRPPPRSASSRASVKSASASAAPSASRAAARRSTSKAPPPAAASRSASR